MASLVGLAGGGCLLGFLAEACSPGLGTNNPPPKPVSPEGDGAIRCGERQLVVRMSLRSNANTEAATSTTVMAASTAASPHGMPLMSGSVVR